MAAFLSDPFKNWTPFKIWTFKIWLLKSSVLGWRLVFQVWLSSPYCTILFYFLNIVGIRKPDMSGFWMLKIRSDCKWSGYRMAFENRTICPVFECKTIQKPDENVRFSRDIWKPDHFVRFSNGQTDPQNVRFLNDSGFRMIPDFEWFRISKGRFSDPHCTAVL